MRTFLLERSRVTSTSKERERSYHVFYELIAGKTPHAPDPVDSYYYLSLSGQTTCPDHDDAEEFRILDTSLLSVGIPRAELDVVWQCVSAMLYLGNIKFHGDRGYFSDNAFVGILLKTG